ncbi:chemotaxis protein CheW [Aquincola sp. MAHUQ-54]|uniref:Chemotaxis protein CheW n=1 Tax=Aquincola agrisoli TaxID=3119538 RepID=A0AAW9Q8E9_9BURK
MSKKILHRGVPFSPDVAAFVARMPTVEEHRENLQRLQDVWDSLALLGQMSGTVPDIGDTRRAFASLGATLLDALASRTLANLRHRLQGRAQVAIDILVRNLFERTADVGFLSTDSALCAHAQRFHAGDAPVPDADRSAIEARFRAYVAKYSVYDDIVVLSPSGRVLARLDRTVDTDLPGIADAPWFTRALRQGGYVEHHGPTPLLGGRCGLLYASAVRGPAGGVAGVLCLSFRLDDEMHRVFRQLLAGDDADVLVLVDAAGRVVASSDPWQLPAGAPLRPAGAARLRFAGRDYLAVAANATGYEGYHGPGWSALALAPIDQAFEALQADDANDGIASLATRLDTRGLFDAGLLAIAPQARRIEQDLSRLLWNGRLRRQRATATVDAAFADTLLNEVGQTGERLRGVFDQAIGNLYRATLAAVFDQARHHARLAIDIMDRNLYERANDCRWWALDGVLRETLAEPPQTRSIQRAAAVLRHINGLYTVYSLLVLFDAAGCVVAVSDPAAAHWQGRVLDEPWVADTLAARDSQSHAVSRHLPSTLYGGRPTYVYGACVRDDGGRALGGIAIVFDGAPQFAAMLADALPHGAASCALLVSRSGTVVASSDERFAVGSSAPLPPGWASLERGEAGSAVIDLDGVAHAAGYAMAGGYREYPVAPRAPQDDVGALVLTRLGDRLPQAAPALEVFTHAPSASHARGAQALQVAGFRIDDTWLGLPADQVIQAPDTARFTPLPSTPRHLPGLLAFEDEWLPVLDLALLRGSAAPAPADAPLVVVQAARHHRLALRVHALGPVFEVPADAVQALPGGPERLVRGTGLQMLTLLDARLLWQATSNEPAAAIA